MTDDRYDGVGVVVTENLEQSISKRSNDPCLCLALSHRVHLQPACLPAEPAFPSFSPPRLSRTTSRHPQVPGAASTCHKCKFAPPLLGDASLRLAPLCCLVIEVLDVLHRALLLTRSSNHTSNTRHTHRSESTPCFTTNIPDVCNGSQLPA